jgi:hypothetical protein
MNVSFLITPTSAWDLILGPGENGGSGGKETDQTIILSREHYSLAG